MSTLLFLQANREMEALGAFFKALQFLLHVVGEHGVEDGGSAGEDVLVALELPALAHDTAVRELAVVEDVAHVLGQPRHAGRLRHAPAPSGHRSEQR